MFSPHWDRKRPDGASKVKGGGGPRRCDRTRDALSEAPLPDPRAAGEGGLTQAEKGEVAMRLSEGRAARGGTQCLLRVHAPLLLLPPLVYP